MTKKTTKHRKLETTETGVELIFMALDYSNMRPLRWV